MSGVIFDKILGRIREGGDEGGGGGNYALIENTPQIVVVNDDLFNITGEQLESLKVGDIATVHTSFNDYSCVVYFKTNNSVYFSYIYGDTRILNIVKFVKQQNKSWTHQLKQYPFVTLKENSQPVAGMQPGKFYSLGELAGDTVFVISGAENGVANVWHWSFSIGATKPNITWPSEITIWNGGNTPDISANKHYEIVVINNFGICLSDNQAGGVFPSLTENTFPIAGANGELVDSPLKMVGNYLSFVGSGTAYGTAMTLMPDGQIDLGFAYFETGFTCNDGEAYFSDTTDIVCEGGFILKGDDGKFYDIKIVSGQLTCTLHT